MNPRVQNAGFAGVLAGLAWAAGLTFLMLSGYNPQSLSDPAAALAFLREGGATIRVAALFGAAGIALRMIFVAGLAASLQARTPTRAAATRYFGLLGAAGHGLLALSLYVGIPMLVALAAQDAAAAVGAMGAFATVTGGIEAFGNFLLGLMLLAAGWAIVTQHELPLGAGWAGLLAGVATLAHVLLAGTPLAGFTSALFLAALLLAGVFEIWVGLTLWWSAMGAYRTSGAPVAVRAD